MSPRIVPLPEAGPLTHHFSSYVDVTVTNSALAFFVILIGALWALYAFNRLWQRSLTEDAAGALSEAEALGIARQPLGLGAKVEAAGQWQGHDVRLTWAGGIRGARTVLRLDGEAHRSGLLAEADALQAALERAAAQSA